MDSQWTNDGGFCFYFPRRRAELFRDSMDTTSTDETNEAQSGPYHGRLNRYGKLISVGRDRQEAIFRAGKSQLNIASHDDRDEPNVTADQYRDWWWKELSEEQRELLRQVGGSQPPPE
jgi:hypothetical protein